ncbi:uncharacterized protein K452DRAFT_241415 [Aplosporella prunicola CBS 121167]|uniref:Fe2OG dioxygenase domain-containing protein n=1 Tax=Aplosporella prunicola CBS 121167 TaxID=1176127 RepID=A0A6A6BR17_9PEZI|nr:uncharacterized protein K452DRAFT_241415 [Aplosporella prunicola CBS 121167]KAF2146559.1 hypothetical protein K452DRAFT_241415 [Aplosporella prunicola CBS 121167]
MSKKRTLDNFFKPVIAKRQRVESTEPPSNHTTYPFPVPQLPPNTADVLNFCPATEGKLINDQPDLDLVYFQPYIAKDAAKDLFHFLRRELFFYRVKYSIKRGPVETQISTPRFTTVFGLDDSAVFSPDGTLVTRVAKTPVPVDRYKCLPRPIPGCLDRLRKLVEAATDCTYNFCLVNYYASGNDSIAYHSDDERFLGPRPAIASLSLGASRDFYMKHKPVAPSPAAEKDAPPLQVGAKPLTLALGSGDMVLMRGTTQKNWLHSIPKRKGGESDRGRINITFRRAMVRGGTDNYYQYNVGVGPVFKWDETKGEMREWNREKEEGKEREEEEEEEEEGGGPGKGEGNSA